MTVEFRLLGEVEVRVDGAWVDVGHARQRDVLVALLVDANQTVSVDALIDRVWGDRSPLRARTTLSSYLTRLRHALARAGGAVDIARRSGGYVFTVDPRRVDLHQFRLLVAEARDAEYEHGAELLDQALDLWRGEAFATLDSAWLNETRGALNSQRLAAELDRNDLRLRLGHHARILSDLAVRIKEHPLDERLAGQLMLALTRSGRPAEALRVFEETRRTLSNELGIDPSAELSGLHARILRSDPELAVPTAHRPKPAGGRNDLPRDIPDFTGGEKEIARLLSALPDDGEPARATVIETIDGMAGVGKTTLAVHFAHRLAGRYPDAQLFIDLHGHTDGREAVDPMTALDVLLRALGVRGDQIPYRLEDRAALWRAEMAERAALVVLDNAASAAQVQPLLPSGARCLTLVTSRRRLVDLDATRNLSLDVLARADGITLFHRIVDDDRTTADPLGVDDIVALCGDLPLAIRIAAARLRSRPVWTIRHLSERLRDRRHRLAELAAGERSVAAAFTLSYQDLTEVQQRMFRLLGLHPGPDVDVYAAASLANLDAVAAERALEDLLDTHLLEQPSPGRYRFHDLLRLHARTTAQATEPESAGDDALRRLVDYYTHAALVANRLLDPTRPPIRFETLESTPTLLAPADETAAGAWFDDECVNLMATQQFANTRRWHASVWQLAWTMHTYQHRRGHLDDNLKAWQLGLAASTQLDDLASQCLAHRYLGSANGRLGRHDEAVRYLQHALTLAQDTADHSAEASTHLSLAYALAQQGDDERAHERATQALGVVQTLDNPHWEALALNALGWCEAQLGQYERAVGHCEAALALARRHDDRDVEAPTYDSLGYIADRAGDHTQALSHYHQAIALYRELGNSYEEANTLARLGEAHHTLGESRQARHAWNLALGLYEAQSRTADVKHMRERLRALEQRPNGS